MTGKVTVNGDGEGGVRLFAYGTLQEPEVQRSVFGREVVGEPDALPGYTLGWIEIREGGVVTRYRNVVPSENAGDEVAGFVLVLNEAELVVADDYEGPTNYLRVPAILKSGRNAFIYIGENSDS